MAPSSPIVARWELMLRLRERRKELDVSPATIAKKLRISSGYWSHIEGERNLLSEDKLTSLLELLEFDDDEKRELLQLRTAAKERGWWARYSGIIGPDLMRIIGLEHGAQTIRIYESILIPGLLQTKPYTQALITPSLANVRPAEVDQLVAVRMRRRDRLTEGDPLQLTAIIGETALVQATGGPTVLREQLEHLAAMIDQHPDTLDIRIIPFTSPEGNALGGATFRLLDFDSTKLPTLAWLEAPTSSETSDNPTLVQGLSYAFTQAQNMALDREDSLALIKRSIRTLKSRS
ncbi:helix-turn-helix domain-containing protein [Nocardia terpenica]|uniref:Helix-turn-helix domain-containing protein n=1 Tax=Nocardia terpenica TaxID=455432 RepID=A0A6G9Z5X0_9NOCA|nr:helix-turn-helix transcriptional regulator [Nocardia terpenica]QIS20892.1 helix-turn-helix domain-containing protein [Nocardia terpenica]